jgi:LysM repeat protein
MDPLVKIKVSHNLKLLLFVLLVIAILASALPRPVFAAKACQSYYTVQAGDTTPYIAHTHYLKWQDIAEANGMKTSDRIMVGQQLCIPASKIIPGGKPLTTPTSDKYANLHVSIFGGRISFSLSRFYQEHVYLVKVRDPAVGIKGWSKVGYIRIKKTTSASAVFEVPKSLRYIPNLWVCLKDQTTNELICRLAFNP